MGKPKGKLSYKQVVEDSSPTFSTTVEFNGVFQRKIVDLEQQGWEGGWSTTNGGGHFDGSANIGGGGGENGKFPSLSPKTLSLSPNEDMVSTIKSERSRLKSIAIFFVCLDKEAMPARKFFDDWLASVWGKKLGIYVTYCRMIQKGLFVVFLKSHNM